MMTCNTTANNIFTQVDQVQKGQEKLEPFGMIERLVAVTVAVSKIKTKQR